MTCTVVPWSCHVPWKCHVPRVLRQRRCGSRSTVIRLTEYQASSAAASCFVPASSSAAASSTAAASFSAAGNVDDVDDGDDVYIFKFEGSFDNV